LKFFSKATIFFSNSYRRLGKEPWLKRMQMLLKRWREYLKKPWNSFRVINVYLNMQRASILCKKLAFLFEFVNLNLKSKDKAVIS